MIKITSNILILLLGISLSFGQVKFEHILITNDDGIEDADRLIALARSVKEVAKRVSVIVPASDRSGTSNHAVYGKYQHVFEANCKYVDTVNNIAAYTLPANPADCVLLGLCGFFGEDRPDLVLSGINGGPNIGPGWFGSGTIGAVRTAAFLGVRGIALSGFNDEEKLSFKIIPDWIKRFISSGFLDDMEKESYLTVGFPRIPLNKVKGIKLAERKTSYENPGMFKLKKIFGQNPNEKDNLTIWALDINSGQVDEETTKDDYFLGQGFIVITPMQINENNKELMETLSEKTQLIPEFI